MNLLGSGDIGDTGNRKREFLRGELRKQEQLPSASQTNGLCVGDRLKRKDDPQPYKLVAHLGPEIEVLADLPHRAHAEAGKELEAVAKRGARDVAAQAAEG